MGKSVFFCMGILLALLFSSCSNHTDPLTSEEIEVERPYFAVIFDPDTPGCGDCHSSLEEPDKTLAAKANDKWEDHNFGLDELMTINDCLFCHRTIAPTPLRSIVHKVHMSSPHFSGNCFTCHIIMGESTADLYQYPR